MKNIELSSSAYQLSLLQTQIYRSVRELMKANLINNKVTYTQWFVLAHVCRGPVGGYSMKDVAESLSLPMPQLTLVTAELVERKLLRQRIAANDKRQRNIRCTNQGKVLCETIELDLDAAAADWLEGLSADQQANYYSLLRVLEQSRPKYIGMRGATVIQIKR